MRHLARATADAVRTDAGLVVLRKSGSLMMAVRATAEKAMFWAESRLLPQATTAAPSSPGASSAHCSACAPSEPPIAASGRAIPR